MREFRVRTDIIQSEKSVTKLGIYRPMILRTKYKTELTNRREILLIEANSQTLVRCC